MNRKLLLPLAICLATLRCSCLYKAGNRQPDINYNWRSGVSTYYLKQYLLGLDSHYANRPLITSEIVNFPDSFVPVTDSAEGLKFVLEFSSTDSGSAVNSAYFGVASIYDFRKNNWITERDSLRNNELGRFKRFLDDLVLPAVLRRYRGSVPDSALQSGAARIEPLNEPPYQTPWMRD